MTKIKTKVKLQFYTKTVEKDAYYTFTKPSLEPISFFIIPQIMFKR